LRGITGLADHSKVGLVLQDATKSRANELVIVDKKNGDAIGRRIYGSTCLSGTLRKGPSRDFGTVVF
jgi:hypothetical protein